MRRITLINWAVYCFCLFVLGCFFSCQQEGLGLAQRAGVVPCAWCQWKRERHPGSLWSSVQAASRGQGKALLGSGLGKKVKKARNSYSRDENAGIYKRLGISSLFYTVTDTEFPAASRVPGRVVNMPKMPVALVTLLPEKRQHPLQRFFVWLFLKKNFLLKETDSMQVMKGLHLLERCWDRISVLCGENQGRDWSS